MEYGELNVNEIAYQMGYSSSAHLSTQFKSVTGLTSASSKLPKKRAERRLIRYDHLHPQ
jgi:AraC family transcriptional regulator